MEYFEGSWRNELLTPDGRKLPDYWYRTMPWIGAYEMCLAACACLEKWDQMKKLATYPENHAPLSDGKNHEDRKALIMLSKILLTPDSKDLKELVSELNQCSNRKINLLSRLVESILKKSNGDVTDAFVKYMQNYKKFEFKKPQMTNKVSLEGTYLYYFAKSFGQNIQISTEFHDFLLGKK